MIPKVLIFHTLGWPNALRLAMAFHRVGCSVEALCLPRDPLKKLRSVAHCYPYRPHLPLRSLRSAISLADPILIIPCDEGAVAQLIRLYFKEADSDVAGRRVREAIRRSMGKVEGYQRIATRSNLPAIASEAQVPLPATRLVTTEGELRDGLQVVAFPAVLKSDYSWSGYGVSVVHDFEEAKRARRRMGGLRPRIGAVRRLLRDRDVELFVHRFCNGQSKLTLQKFVPGSNANAAVACWQGEVLASICVEVLVMTGEHGRSSVVRIIENAEMLETAKQVARLNEISGFLGFDFILEKDSGRANLIEINPRATQINHLALGRGRDLTAALRAAAAHEPISWGPAVTDRDTIALFPNEWHRDPQSSYLRTAYHDVPWDEPEMIRIYAGYSAGASR